MERRAVELLIGGHKYRVVSSASEDELQRLATVVSAKLREVAPHGSSASSSSAPAMLLAAMALAHEAETERVRREAIEGRAREMLQRVLARVDEALGVERDAERAPGE